MQESQLTESDYAAVDFLSSFIGVDLLCVSDLHGVLLLVLSTVGLLFCQALTALSIFFACEVMPTVIR